MSSFSDRVKDLRLERNLSLRQLSKLTDISPSAIHAYEMGKREASYQSLEALSDVFNCDIDYILGKTDVRNSVANALGFNSLYEAHKAGVSFEKLDLQLMASKNPTANYDGISEKRRELIEFAMTVPEEKAEMILRVMKSIVEFD